MVSERISDPIRSERQQLLDALDRRFDIVEALIMATKADLESALTRLQTAVSGRIDDVNAKLTAMQGTLDTFVSEDAVEDSAFQAEIADLKAQLQAQLDAAVASVNAMADAVAQPA